MNAKMIAQTIESHAPMASGLAGDELGFIFGTGQTPVRGVAACWSPTLRVIREAAPVQHARDP